MDLFTCHNIPPAARERYGSLGYEVETGKPLGVCILARCLKPRNQKRLICNMHRQKIWRKQNPESARYETCRTNAKRRRKVWGITREEWAALCRLTRYHEGTGWGPEALTLDRIDSRKGYTLDNVRVIVQRLNSAKGAQEMTCRLPNGKAVVLALAAVSVAEQLTTEPDNIETIIDRI